MDRLVRDARPHGLVLLAGAGLSMPAPTSLPGWNAFNSIVLGALARHVATYGGAQFVSRRLEELIAHRDRTTSFAPDFQAQLMEEECGLAYFRVLQALDTAVTNAGHQAVAALARGRVLRAIVTTNFDRLVERALATAEVPYRVFASPADFDTLGDALAGNADAALPVIKVHGSVEAPEHMVDSLRQRLAGRPASLETALAALLRGYPWVAVGFSGADLAYDREYLALRAGAEGGVGLTVLRRPGTEALEAMRDLVAAWGDRGRFLDGDLPATLERLAERCGAPRDARAAHAPALEEDPGAARRAEVTARAEAWAASLEGMQTVNLLTALLQAAGAEEDAFTFRHWVWRYYRRGTDAETASYWRYQHQFGQQLLARGALGHDVDVMPAMESGLRRRVGHGQLALEPEENAWQFLGRAWTDGHRPLAYVELAYILALTRDVTKARNTIKLVRDTALAERDLRTFVDAVIVGGWVHEMAGNFSDGLDWTDRALEIVREVGDEPRRAALAAHRVRFLARIGRGAEALALLADARTVAQRLALASTAADLELGAGILANEERDWPRATEALGRALEGYTGHGPETRLVPCLTELALAYYRAGDPAQAMRSIEQGEALLGKYRSYAPHHYLNTAALFAFDGQFGAARGDLDRAVDAGEATRNPWVAGEAERLRAWFTEIEARARADSTSP